MQVEKKRIWDEITPRLLDSVDEATGERIPDPAPFLSYLAMVKTKDEKDEGKVKPFPLDKEYMVELAAHFVQERLLLVPKSRQMTVSWLAVAYCTYKAQTKPNQLVLWISKNLEDACDMVYNKDDPLVARSSFICEHLPRWVFDKPRGMHGSLIWPNGSQMVAIQQSPEAVRSKSASLIVSDEMAFQEQADKIYTAAKPSITGGGQFIGISSANPGFFWDAVEDRFDTEYAESIA